MYLVYNKAKQEQLYFIWSRPTTKLVSIEALRRKPCFVFIQEEQCGN